MNRLWSVNSIPMSLRSRTVEVLTSEGLEAAISRTEKYVHIQCNTHEFQWKWCCWYTFRLVCYSCDSSISLWWRVFFSHNFHVMKASVYRLEEIFRYMEPMHNRNLLVQIVEGCPGSSTTFFDTNTIYGTVTNSNSNSNSDSSFSRDDHDEFSCSTSAPIPSAESLHNFFLPGKCCWNVWCQSWLCA